MRTKVFIGLAASAVLMSTALPASAADPVVVDNLTTPLGFAVSDNGSFYVAEAFAGQLTKIGPHGHRSPLASVPPGSSTAGVALTKDGSVYYTITLPPEQGDPPDTALGIVHPDGSNQILASLLDFETANNPDSINTYGIQDDGACYEAFSSLHRFVGPPSYSGDIESNPYAVADEGYGSAVVADAAGNDIVRVVNGHVSLVAVLPPILQKLDRPTVRKQMRQINRKLIRHGKDPLPVTYLDSCIGKQYAGNPVPTDVEIGPDGNFYVSTLPGSPEMPGYGKVFKINAATGALHVVAKGFSGATDLAVADDGTIYVSELYAFQVSTVAPGEHSATSAQFVNCPTAVELDGAGQLYAAEGGICGPDPGRIITLED